MNDPVVLLVEDDPAHAELANRSLSSVKVSVHCVETVASAKEWLARASADVVLADLRLPDGSALELTSFPLAVQRKDDETVVFSWITWFSRAARDEGMKKAMADPRLQPGTHPMPFDGKRLIYGGFEVLMSA